MTDANEWEVDLFSDDYIGIRRKRYESADQILEELVAEDSDKKAARHAKHTRKPRKEGPEAKAQARLRVYLEKEYKARVLRTNAGFIRDEHGNTIQLGDPGQSDLHAIIPFMINGHIIGIFAAFEVKAGNNTATDTQETYLANIAKRGGIAAVIRTVIDVDEAIAAKRAELLSWFKNPA